MTATEIIREINEDIMSWGYNDVVSPNPVVGKFKSVARRGGSDQGTQWWNVIYFEDHDIYIKIDGYYTSYNGVDDLEAFEVEPKEVMITVYNKK